MKKHENEEDLYYGEFKKDAANLVKPPIKYAKEITDPKVLEPIWFYGKEEMQYDERDRLIVVLAVAKVESDFHMLSEDLLIEIELYYRDFNEGKIDDLLFEAEYDEIKEDLFWCYEHRKENLYKN